VVVAVAVDTIVVMVEMVLMVDRELLLFATQVLNEEQAAQLLLLVATLIIHLHLAVHIQHKEKHEPLR
jgi:hypothetical protein